MTYICSIELDDIAPKVWRKFQFHPDITFHQLHKIIQVVMGWENYHLYTFHINGQEIELPNESYEDMAQYKGLNARRIMVKEHLKEKNTVFTYTYDFGDDWKHTIRLLEIDSYNKVDPVPICLDGANCCPPEDVGGVWGHQHMMEALSTPNHPECEQFSEWLKDGYDPEYFSSTEVNNTLKNQKNKIIPKSLIQPLEIIKPVKLSKSALNKYLKTMSAEQLAELVKECYSSSKEMEKFLAVKIIGQEAVESLFVECRKKVEHEFFPERGHGKLRLQEAKKAISEFERLTDNIKYTVELKMVYVEMGVSFTCTYGDIDERFYNSIESAYANVINTLNDDETGELFEDYEERISAVVSNTSEIGWGFHDTLDIIHSQLRWM